MKVAELYQAVAKLGFEDSLEDIPGFFHAANRAIIQVNDLRPAISSVTVNHRPPRNLIEGSGFEPIERSEELIFSATNAKAYYFEVDGTGGFNVERFDPETGKWNIIYREDFDTACFTPRSGLIPQDGQKVSGNVRLRFIGDYVYYVRSVALYGTLRGPTADRIPAYEEFTSYDMTKLAPDFMSFCDYPITEDGRRVCDGYDVEGGHLLLFPYDRAGTYRIAYKRRPTELVYTEDVAEDETEIDLEGALASLLPPLIAAYVWLDDESEKAEYYLNLYRERVSLFEKNETRITPAVYRTNGW